MNASTSVVARIKYIFQDLLTEDDGSDVSGHKEMKCLNIDSERH